MAVFILKHQRLTMMLPHSFLISWQIKIKQALYLQRAVLLLALLPCWSLQAFCLNRSIQKPSLRRRLSQGHCQVCKHLLSLLRQLLLSKPQLLLWWEIHISREHFLSPAYFSRCCLIPWWPDAMMSIHLHLIRWFPWLMPAISSFLQAGKAPLWMIQIWTMLMRPCKCRMKRRPKLRLSLSRRRSQGLSLRRRMQEPLKLPSPCPRLLLSLSMPLRNQSMARCDRLFRTRPWTSYLPRSGFNPEGWWIQGTSASWIPYYRYAGSHNRSLLELL